MTIMDYSMKNVIKNNLEVILVIIWFMAIGGLAWLLG